MKKINISLITLFILSVVLIPILTSADTLYRQLEVGSRGADVSTLQSFLASDSTIYPSGLVTGYFGPLTKAAVMRFQARNGISQVGRVGPITLAAINAQMSGSIIGTNVNSPFVERAPGFTSAAQVFINGSSATFTVNTDMPTTAVAYYSPSPIVAFENDNVSPVTVTIGGEAVSDNAGLKTAHTINSLALIPNTTYYGMIAVKDVNGVVSLVRTPTFRIN